MIRNCPEDTAWCLPRAGSNWWMVNASSLTTQLILTDVGIDSHEHMVKGTLLCPQPFPWGTGWGAHPPFPGNRGYDLHVERWNSRTWVDLSMIENRPSLVKKLLHLNNSLFAHAWASTMTGNQEVWRLFFVTLALRECVALSELAFSFCKRMMSPLRGLARIPQD